MANFNIYLNSDSYGKLQVLHQLFDEVNSLTTQVKTLVAEVSEIKTIIGSIRDGTKNNN